MFDFNKGEQKPSFREDGCEMEFTVDYGFLGRGEEPYWFTFWIDSNTKSINGVMTSPGYLDGLKFQWNETYMVKPPMLIANLISSTGELEKSILERLKEKQMKPLDINCTKSEIRELRIPWPEPIELSWTRKFRHRLGPLPHITLNFYIEFEYDEDEGEVKPTTIEEGLVTGYEPGTTVLRKWKPTQLNMDNFMGRSFSQFCQEESFPTNNIEQYGSQITEQVRNYLKERRNRWTDTN